MNFLGLGVSFGAKDDGLITALGGIEARLAGIQESLVGMGSVKGVGAAAEGIVEDAKSMESSVVDAAEGFKSFGADATDSLLGISDTASDVETDVGSGLFKTRSRLKLTGFGFISLGAIVSGLTAPIRGVSKLMGGLARAFSPAAFDAGLKQLQDGMNLMNSMESELFSTGISARQMGAQFGYTGAELDKFESRAASMAYSLDVGVETAARAIRGFTEAESEMRAVGITSAQDLARFSESFGVNADTLRNNLMAMRRAGGLSDEQIAQVTSSMVQMGQQTGDVTGALEQLPETMEMIRDQAALMGPDFKLSSQQIADFAVSTQSVAAGFFSVFQDSDKARASASTISKALIESQSGFQNMLAGTADSLDTFRQEMNILGLESDASFNALKKGPQGFLEGMSQMYASLKKTGNLTESRANFIRGRLEAALGGEAANEMMTFFASADASALKLMGTVSNASENLGKLGKEAHKASFNLSDRFERALAAANTQLRSLTRKDTRQFVRGLGKDVRGIGKSLRAAGKEGGPLSGALKIISSADQLGGLAFVPKQLRATAVVAGEASGALMKTWESFKAGGGAIGLVRNGIALFVTDMIASRKEGETWEKSFNKTANKFADIYAPMIEDAGNFVEKWVAEFAKIDWENIFSGDADPESAMGKIQEAFKSIDWKAIWDNISKGFSALWDQLKPYVVKFMDWAAGHLENFWDEHGDVIRKAFWGGIISMFSLAALMPILWGALTAVGSAIASALIPWVTGAFASVGAAILGAFTAPVWAIIGIIAAVVAAAAAIWYAFGDEIKIFANDLWNSVTYVFEKIGGFFGDLFGGEVTQIFKDLANSISWVFDEITSYADTLLGGAFGKVWDFFTGGEDDADKIAEGLSKTTEAAKSLDKEFGKLNQHERDLGRRRTQFAYASADPRIEQQRQKQLAGMSEELRAIHDPMWWSGAGGYRELFDRRMTQLIAASTNKANSTSPTAPPSGSRRMTGRKPPSNVTTAPGSGGSRAKAG